MDVDIALPGDGFVFSRVSIGHGHMKVGRAPGSKGTNGRRARDDSLRLLVTTPTAFLLCVGQDCSSRKAVWHGMVPSGREHCCWHCCLLKAWRFQLLETTCLGARWCSWDGIVGIADAGASGVRSPQTSVRAQEWEWAQAPLKSCACTSTQGVCLKVCFRVQIAR